MPDNSSILRHIASMAVCLAPGGTGYPESFEKIKAWAHGSTTEDLDSIFRVVAGSAALPSYDAQRFDPVIAGIITQWMKRDPEAVVSRFHISAASPWVCPSLILAIMDSMARPECFPLLAKHADDLEELTEDDIFHLIYGLAYSTAPESVGILESLVDRINPDYEGALSDLTSTCIPVARERSAGK
jgi:hypothetical protein